MPPQFPDTPRGRYAASLDGRCPVHDQPLKVGPGFCSRMDLYPSHSFEEQQQANPFCLDLGESFTDHPKRDPATLIWCPACVLAVGG